MLDSRDCGQIASFKVCTFLFPVDMSRQNHDTPVDGGAVKCFPNPPSKVISVKLCQLKHTARNLCFPSPLCHAEFLDT